MIRRTLAFVLLGVLSGSAADAQTQQPTTVPGSKVFSFSFDGDGGYLGIQTEEIGRDNMGRFGLREVRGVGVEKVIDGSPAQAAGLQNGDVIIRLDGEEITSVRKLTRLLSETAPDHQARITVLRSGSERELTVTLGKRPSPQFADGAFKFEFPMIPPVTNLPDIQALPSIPDFPSGDFVWRGFTGRQIGVGVTPLTKQLGDHFGVTNGVLINNVRENSPAAKAGLKAGDIIVEAEGNEIKTDRDLARAISEKKTGDVQLTIVRGGSRQTLRVMPEEIKGGLNQFFELKDGDNFMKVIPPATPGEPLKGITVPGRVH